MSDVLKISNVDFLKIKKSYSIEDIKEKLDIIKKGILENVPAKKIYLFGSYAYGKPQKNSDIDIYALIPDNFDKSVIKTIGKIANYVYPFGILNMDLFLVEEYRFNYYITYSSFEKTICNKGILLYGN